MANDVVEIDKLIQAGPAPARRVAALVDLHFTEIDKARRLRWEWPAIALSLGLPAQRWKAVAAAYHRMVRQEREVSHA